MRRHFTSKEFDCAHAYIFSLIELAHERIYRVRANDIRVDIQYTPSVEGLGSPLFVEMHPYILFHDFYTCYNLHYSGTPLI